MSEVRHSAEATDLLRLSRDQQYNFRWPLAIDQRLDDLVARANAAGANTSRKELAAALLLACELSGDELAEHARKYRVSTIGEALLDRSVPDNNVVEFVQRGPGRRASAKR